jgi:hypothetical protein
MESHLGGPIHLEKFVKGMQGYHGKDPVKVLEMTKEKMNPSPLRRYSRM